MNGSQESTLRRSTSIRRYALVAVVALVVVGTVAPWVGVALADGHDLTADGGIAPVTTVTSDPSNETDDATNDSVETTLATTTTTASDDSLDDSSDDRLRSGAKQDETSGELRSGVENDSNVSAGTDSSVNGTDSQTNHTDPSANRTDSPANQTDLPANQTDEPTNRTDPSANGTDQAANRTGESANRTGPPNGTAGSERGGPERAALATVNATVENASANEPVSVNVSHPARRNDSVAFDSVAVTPAKNANFTLNTTASDAPIANRTPTTDLPNGTQSLGFLSVDHSIDDENITNVTFTFSVQKDRVNASERDEIALYRFKNGSWNELPTTLVETTDTHYVYRVRSPGLSEFAAGKQTAQFQITEASVEIETLSVGDALKVRVRITNEGDADGTFTAELVLDGEAVAHRQLTIASGGMRQTTFERTMSQPGTYEVYVNDFRVGDVTVNRSDVSDDATSQRTSDDQATDSDETDAADSAENDASAGVPGFGVPTVVALVGTLLAVRWRER
jgi:PGF-pre-PGF domain-containing protein